MTCRLDSSVLCILEPRLCVHWLLSRTWRLWDSQEMFPCKFAISSEPCKAGLINCDPIAKYSDTERPWLAGRLSTLPGRVTGFSQVGIVPDDAVGRRVFFRGSAVSPTLSFRRRSILTSITLIGSQDLTVKSRLNLFTSLAGASSGTIPTCENPGVNRPGIEPGSPWWETSGLTAQPPWAPRILQKLEGSRARAAVVVGGSRARAAVVVEGSRARAAIVVGGSRARAAVALRGRFSVRMSRTCVLWICHQVGLLDLSSPRGNLHIKHTHCRTSNATHDLSNGKRPPEETRKHVARRDGRTRARRALGAPPRAICNQCGLGRRQSIEGAGHRRDKFITTAGAACVRAASLLQPPPPAGGGGGVVSDLEREVTTPRGRSSIFEHVLVRDFSLSFPLVVSQLCLHEEEECFGSISLTGLQESQSNSDWTIRCRLGSRLPGANWLMSDSILLACAARVRVKNRWFTSVLSSTLCPVLSGLPTGRPSSWSKDEVLCTDFRLLRMSTTLESRICTDLKFHGAAVAYLLDYWHPTKGNRVQSPAGSPRIFASGIRAGGSRGSPPPPSYSGAAPSSPHFTLISSQDLALNGSPEHALTLEQKPGQQLLQSGPTLPNSVKRGTFLPARKSRQVAPRDDDIRTALSGARRLSPRDAGRDGRPQKNALPTAVASFILYNSLLTHFKDKIDVKHAYSEVTFAIGSQFIRHALDDSEPIADFQGNNLPADGDTLAPFVESALLLNSDYLSYCEIDSHLTALALRTAPFISAATLEWIQYCNHVENEAEPLTDAS
ncbi:hypothetical protein PR048_021860 [Dryococelus australis]|uniref:Uncharacterized protein n=1 Tax=Dryococelus australis TaxID=614101 RepID=A0ABQ9GZG2_9NEOP|nr:hypothetical protein PR048_021860 [Dryococelus australis]